MNAMNAIFHMTKPRRKYRTGNGRCQDCGNTDRTTLITWWSSGFTYRVCVECIKPYRHLITRPCACEGN